MNKMMPFTFQFIRKKWRVFTSIHPLIRGSISYAILWPSSSLMEQTLEGRNFKTYDYMRLLRFGLYGSLYVAPTLHGWFKLTSAMWPQTNLKIGLIKAGVEQMSYGPFACASFFVGMSLLEGKCFSEAVEEMKEKFLPTYKVGFCVWPILQTINFSLIPERHRIIYVSICSFLWTSFLAYMKRKELAAAENQIGKIF